MLHTLAKSPTAADLTTLCAIAGNNDAILLLQDGVLCGLVNTHSLEKLISASTSLYALKADVIARGLSARISSNIVLLDYNQFVELSVKHPQQLSW
ncbi:MULTISPECIES: sulfurtransferase complex subunit TusB [Hafnia]|jgi:tRNA 2-thiouridine synthesizing protein B|uniref:Protein TusB n=2 Tax=Hafnia TaxID=568 RepID=A0A2A2MD35_9GAMM|nr:MULTISPECIES: sulfurtransferase complex subunit TusB [Hafnia]EFV38946.2 sulfur relay protein TusB/DsrH [Enterobacteriaceae bacterium 9_2_54FAA]EIQ9989522.1 sulfurtransferase complex subunit TusB [Escherichia coli]MDU1192450.1 sulfurtransferase complex subunit TusB [Enterobacteriaceae bacterium]AMH17641.1 sulfurtransferase TusB [Hafnia paralvei]EHM44920.1 sulfur relay protein TusB/DsrH [Hafnia alvei ATCC 51873]